MSDEVVAIIGSSAFANWVSYSVDLDFLTPTDAFTLTVANPTPTQIAQVAEGTPITLLVGRAAIFSGWVDEKRHQGSRSGDTMTLVGRDALAPLVDCHAPRSWTWRNISLVTLATKACLELGVALGVEAVSAEASTPITWVHAEPGETYWDVLDREARRLRLMLWSTPGVLHIGRPTYTGAVVGQLRRMVSSPLNGLNNVKSAESTWRVSGRRSPVTCTGQAPGSELAASMNVTGQATDPDLLAAGLVRPCLIHDAGVRTSSSARARAEWEVSRRRGEAWVGHYTVPGHAPAADDVWMVNTLVDLADERIGLSGPRWISGARFIKSRGGTETTLTLRDLDSILPAVV